MTDVGVSAETFNVRIVSLRFFFGVTCGREEMKRYMQFGHKPRKLPVVLSVEEVADLLAAVPGPGLMYRAALGISYPIGGPGRIDATYWLLSRGGRQAAPPDPRLARRTGSYRRPRDATPSRFRRRP